MNTNTSEGEQWTESKRKLIKTWIDETLRFIYAGETAFDIHVSNMKIIIELPDGSKMWWFYSLSNIDRNDIVGAVVVEMMDRKTS